MKVSHSKQEPVDIANLSRSKKSDKASALKSQRDDEVSLAGTLGDAAAVNISSDAKTISQAKQVASVADIDQAKVDRIKALMNQGKYKPDFGKVADKVVNEHLMSELS